MPKKINIKGRITGDGNSWLYNLFRIPYTTPGNVLADLEDANGDDVEIYINSGGGSVYDGYEIYNAISEYKGKVTIKIMGLAASAASFIAMAPNAKCYMSPLSEMMIHNASGYVGAGPHQVLDEASQMLQVTDSTIAQAYVLKSGKEEPEIRDLMEQETWFTANHAKELGLIDGILFDEKVQNINPVPTLYNALPINDDVLMAELEKCTTIDEVRAKITENVDSMLKQSLNQPTKINMVVENKKTENEEEGVLMNAQELQQKHPELYNQIVSDAQKEAVANERTRIKEIQNLAVPGVENVIEEGIENGLGAGEVAMNIIKAQKEKGANYMQQAKEDAAPLDQVENPVAPKNNDSKETKEDEQASNMAKFGNQRRGR